MEIKIKIDFRGVDSNNGNFLSFKKEYIIIDDILEKMITLDRMYEYDTILSKKTIYNIKELFDIQAFVTNTSCNNIIVEKNNIVIDMIMYIKYSYFRKLKIENILLEER